MWRAQFLATAIFNQWLTKMLHGLKAEVPPSEIHWWETERAIHRCHSEVQQYHSLARTITAIKAAHMAQSTTMFGLPSESEGSVAKTLSKLFRFGDWDTDKSEEIIQNQLLTLLKLASKAIDEVTKKIEDCKSARYDGSHKDYLTMMSFHEDEYLWDTGSGEDEQREWHLPAGEASVVSKKWADLVGVPVDGSAELPALGLTCSEQPDVDPTSKGKGDDGDRSTAAWE